MSKALIAVMLLSIVCSSGCASVRTLDAAQAGAPVIYSGTRLDWYSLQGGCYPVERFGAQAPKYAALDLPFTLYPLACCWIHYYCPGRWQLSWVLV